jgi:6,7-dimethyl-8-ribityllumazine synthase
MKKYRKTNGKKKIAVVVSSFYKEVSEGLLNGALKVLHENGFADNKINIYKCPGAFEIPFTVKKICESKKFSAVICIGAVIKGETAHFEYIASSVARGISKLNLLYNIPITFGVLTCYTYEQAIARSGDGPKNKGAEAASATIEMMKLKV